MPKAWDWVASKHLLQLPYPLNAEDATSLPVEDPDDNLGLQSGLSRERPSSFTPSGDSTLPKKASKPPPPVHKGGASVSPSPAKSSGSVKGSPSRAGSSWEGDWRSTSSQARDWRQRRWYH